MRPWLLLSLIVSSAGVTGSARGEGPTYHRDVERILQARCQECHRPGQVAPFPLLTYEHARKRASDIATVTEHRTMPPWHASTKEGGPFRDVAILSDAERATLADWSEAGAPEGDPKDAPKPRTWNSEWALGTPDLVLTMPQSYTLAAEGRDELRVFVVPSGLTEGKWIAAVDFRPGNAKVVHHVLSAFDVRGAARKLDAADPEPGYHSVGGYGMIPSGGLGGWSPGKRPIRYADGVGRYLPAGADILIQVHYHRSGKVETDATSIGLYYCKAPVDKQLRGAMVTPPRPGLFQRPRLLIPAGDPNYEVTGTLTLSEDSHLVAVTPHMHWIGKDFLLKATRPDGSSTTLIKIDDWDFNWQMGYDYATPVALPKGTRIDMVAHFDNSAANPDNQNKPPADVRWGEQTTDEMCIGFLHLTSDSEHRHNSPPPRFATQALNR
jgi:hypothetical protein